MVIYMLYYTDVHPYHAHNEGIFCLRKLCHTFPCHVTVAPSASVSTGHVGLLTAPLVSRDRVCLDMCTLFE